MKVPRRQADDLPPKVKGAAYFSTARGQDTRYYATDKSGSQRLVEYINDSWYLLSFNR